MASMGSQRTKRDLNTGAWTAEEDQKLIQVIEIHGAKRWKSLADKAGLNRCGKSCRFRWMNYLRPNIKRGNISDQEEDLIRRLHKLVGNRWSLIAGRLPGRTGNEIKNYWNSHLSKKIHQQGKQGRVSTALSFSGTHNMKVLGDASETGTLKGGENSKLSLSKDELFDFSTKGPLNLE